MTARPQFWMVKSEPEAFSWHQFVSEGRTAWTGVRNFQARKNLRLMQIGDRVLFYHSVSEKAVVGIAQVAATAYRDPSASQGEWDCVDLTPVAPLKSPVSLATIKAKPALCNIALLRQSRLSVLPLSADEFTQIIGLAEPN
jgi:predicted RNA-binding protein with PUA-like domain